VLDHTRRQHQTKDPFGSNAYTATESTAGLHVIHRCVLIDCWTIAELREVVASLEVATVVVDLEPLLIDWAAHDDQLSNALVSFATDVLQRGQSLLVISNARRRLPSVVCVRGRLVRIICRAKKPWQLRLFRACRRPLMVVGDQLLTDGLLAWRLGVPFVRWRPRTSVPWWPKFQSQAGRLIGPVLFRIEDQ
jgi:predicted HAD superfamily phosphohydrolase YqeG